MFLHITNALQTFDIEPETCLRVSAKTGLGLETVLPAVIEQVPCPTGKPNGPLRMLLFDAFHDEYRFACWLCACQCPQDAALARRAFLHPTISCLRSVVVLYTYSPSHT